MSGPDIKTGRLERADYQSGFNCSMHPELNLKQAKIEANRCYFCHDAPCIEACPTDIDIPLFIRKISTENIKGAAIDILSENVMGGTCARVCPVESLCEKVCVRNTSEDKPVTIGLLQQFATDSYFDEHTGEQPFQRQASTGKTVAVVGAGPAGLSCAHRLSLLGHEVKVFEAKDKAGGLNEYGIAAYKMTNNWAQKEVNFILELGGIEIKYGQKLGDNLKLADLRKNHDAVFLGFGLGDVNSLGAEGEDLENVIDAVEYIAQLRQANDFAELPVGNNIVVIGGGSTAIDVAVQTKRLGAENVTLVYRRGEDRMNATWKEREFAQKNGVLVKTWAKPHKLTGPSGFVEEIEFEQTKSDSSGQLQCTGEFFSLKADMVFKAIGQKMDPKLGQADDWPDLNNKKIAVNNDTYETTIPGLYAGGDCVFENDLTVMAVKHGKKAAHAINDFLVGGQNG